MINIIIYAIDIIGDESKNNGLVGAKDFFLKIKSKIKQIVYVMIEIEIAKITLLLNTAIKTNIRVIGRRLKKVVDKKTKYSLILVK